METSETPLMKQYIELKRSVGDALLFFRMGDFYELFGDDAVRASQILEITLTSRDKNKPNPTPMAGVPHHSAGGYIQKLLKAGHRVAIGEQLETLDPETKIVRREVTRIFTPAVQFDQVDKDSRDSQLLAATLAQETSEGKRWVLAALDPSTGDLWFSHLSDSAQIQQWSQKLNIVHFLNIEGTAPAELLQILGEQKGTLVENLPAHFVSQEQSTRTLCLNLGLASLDSFVENSTAQWAMGILLHYTLKSQRLERLTHLKLPSALDQKHSLKLGPKTAIHLDLIPHSDQPSLLEFMDQTKTSLGSRRLRKLLTQPFLNESEIQLRQEATRALSDQPRLTEALRTHLGEIYDLERLLGRIATGLAQPRDTLALGRSLESALRLKSQLSGLKMPVLNDVIETLEKHEASVGPLAHSILSQQKEPAPLVSREGGIFQRGTSPELDHLLELTENGERWLVELEAREREATGISSLKVRYNRVFGYYFEVTKTHLASVPAHYQRKQSMANAERFFTEELKKFEEDILSSDSKKKALEQKLFEELIEKIRNQTREIAAIAEAVAELDVLTCFALRANLPGWCFPELDQSLELEIKAGRHPLVDAGSRGEFVPNDLVMRAEDRRVLLITGPNMGGKSTLMRQIALIVILGQAGAPIPAAQARWGIFSSIHTRIGANDAIARGQSTFMVEMSELAHILHSADERSLIILDEIGRGTSTYDGMSVAWATLEWICNQTRARTLFATHYHELTQLEDRLPTLVNTHMAVEGGRSGSHGKNSNLRFLYLLKEGAIQDSFGIQVAKLAGLPPSLIARSWEVLEHLEKSGQEGQSASVDSAQLSLFSLSSETSETPDPVLATDPVSEKIVEELSQVRVNEMTPLAALNTLSRLKDLMSGQGDRA